MAKDFEDFDFFKKERKLTEIGKSFGLNRSDYGSMGRVAEGYDGPEYEDFNKDLVAAMNNDYDVRTAMTNSGNSDLPTSISNINEAYEVHKFLKKAHKNELNNTGKFSSDNDYANVAQHYIDKENERRMQGVVMTNDLNKMKEQLLEEAIGSQMSDDDTDEDADPTLSDRLQNAEDRLGQAANSPRDLYARNNNNVDKTDEIKDGTRHFFDQYKVDVARGAGLRNNFQSNISNAANLVTDIYGR